MKKFRVINLSLFVAFYLLSPGLIHAQIVRGVVSSIDNETLLGATVTYSGQSSQGTTTARNGSYSLDVSNFRGGFLIASYVGYQSDSIAVPTTLKDTITVNFVLSPAISNLLIEVRNTHLTAERRLDIATERISTEDLKQLPLLFGEADVLRGLQLLPGVQTGAEGQTGLHVRGGSPDQNLILMDGVPIYNPNHIFGFVSAFNPAAVAGVTFRRGGFPARYGGRLSSVIDIDMQGGQAQRLRKELSISPLLAKASLSGSLGSKTTFLVAGRRSLIDLFYSPLLRQDEEEVQDDGRESRFAFGFSDLNVKVEHQLSERDQLSITGYWGRDRYDRLVDRSQGGTNSRTEERQRWGNLVGSLRYRHQWSDRTTQTVQLGYTDYAYEVGDSDNTQQGSDRVRNDLFYQSGVAEANFRTDVVVRTGTETTLRFGGGGISRRFRTGSFEQLLENTREGQEFFRDTTYGRPTLSHLETFTYGELLHRFTNGLSFNLGLHVSGLDGAYWKLQPRLSVYQEVGERTGLKLGFATMRQYLHLVVRGSLGLPNDVWVPATDEVPPQDSWQVSMGMERELSRSWRIELDAYYKQLTNVTNYLPGRGVVSLAPWEGLLTSGNGDAYGVESQIIHEGSRLTGRLAYTLNWSNRQFDALNLGRPFPYRYDRRHDFRLVSTYAIRPQRIFFNATFVYASGNPITVSNSLIRVGSPATSGESLGVVDYESFTDVNGFRIAATHRLDLGITIRKVRGHRQRDISLGLYNAYARRNPYYVNVRLDPRGGGLWRGELVQVNLLRALPSLTYSINW